MMIQSTLKPNITDNHFKYNYHGYFKNRNKLD